MIRVTGPNMQVWKALQEAGRPVHSEELEQKLGWRGPRIRESVNRLVSCGYPIGSNTAKGYYIILSRHEWLCALDEVDGRIRELRRRRDGLAEYGRKQGWKEVTEPEFNFGAQVA